MVEHQDVVGLVADGGDLLGLELVAAGQVAGDLALVGLWVGDVEVVGLGGRRRHVVAELLLGGLRGRGDGVVVVADADQLDDAVGQPVEARPSPWASNLTVQASRSTCGPLGSGTYQSSPR